MRKLFAVIFAFMMIAAPVGAALANEAIFIENSDFSDTYSDGIPSGWYAEAWYDEGGEYEISTELTDGGHSLHITSYQDNDVRLCKEIAVEPNSYYLISCEVKTTGVEYGGGANVSVVDTFAASEPVYAADDWTRTELIGRTERGMDSMIVCLRLGGYGSLSMGEAWFRNFSVTKLDSAPEGANVQNISIADSQQNDSDNTGGPEGLPVGAMLIAVIGTAAAGMLLYRRFILPGGTIAEAEKASMMPVALLLLAAFCIRCALSVIFYGHSTDINCFMAWAYYLAEGGPGVFYTSGFFADYPPGYMYVLWMLGGISNLLGISYGSTAHALLIKMPAILADLAAAYIVYRMATKRFSFSLSMILTAFVAFNPAMAFISGGWGQVDQILTLLLMLTVYLFEEDRLEFAGLIYGIAIITKPQALMAGPLFAAAYFAKVYSGGRRYALRTFVSVMAAVAAIFILSLPFKGAQEPLWFMEKLMGTATSYPYASVEAFNFMALLGGNWAPVGEKVLGLSYGTWGTLFIAMTCIGSIVLYLKSKKDKGSLGLCLGLMLSGIFAFGQYMHERYVFPVLMLIIMAFLHYGDRRLIIAHIMFTCALLLNTLAAFVITGNVEWRTGAYEFITFVGSLMTVASVVYLVGVSVDILAGRIKRHGLITREKQSEIVIKKAEPVRAFTKKDRLYCIGLTSIYGIIALLNLGTTTAPESYWIGDWQSGSVEIRFEDTAEIAEIWVFGGIEEGGAVLEFDSGARAEYKQINSDMFRWEVISEENITASSVRLSVDYGDIWLNEIAFIDKEGKPIPAYSDDAPELVDEQDTVPKAPSYMNGMYFDELYHGRTAYEHLHGLDPYENSHPPLGKVFIMLGIAVFGMNAFGWRIVGTLFGIAMVPIMYAFARRLFKNSEYALVGAGLFAFDFMHFTQTRIATIDVYGVFFIILMYHYMYQYYCMNFHTDGLKATLKPLGIAGLFFGLGAASKWICIYAGGGLAVILFTSLFRRYREYVHFCDSEDAAEREAVKDFKRNTVLTLLWCCVFYIAVPVMIYIASYIPYMLAENPYDLAGVWKVQEFMFSYHSGLTATHPYQSSWWQWPLDLRPVWYFINYKVPSGMSSTISAFGNPAVWWVCSVGAVALMMKLIRGRIKAEEGMFVLLVGLGANYLPWVLVSRCTFAYHFFASVPFILLLTLYLLRDVERRRPELRWIKWAWFGAAVALFAVYYPVISGMPAATDYIKALELLPGWDFLGY
ncbi:MAG: glycosyltransferase family 39 protein [Clostridia bacterium]|nr:glycosyltransferase family 39 protein [Clostridia bacterium]